MKFSKQTIAAQDAAIKAGKVLMKFYETDFKIGQKPGEDEGTITEADHAAEKAIFNVLRKRFPDYNILSEETGEIKNGSDYTWIIDPLDATRNFSCGNPNFCTMIALRHKNDIVSSSIFIPFTNELYLAEKGKGTFLNGRKISVSKRQDLDRFIVLAECLNRMKDDKILGIIRAFQKNVRTYGCVGIDGCLLAAARADACFVYNLKVHDTAPPYLIIKEAGGTVTDAAGKAWSLESKTLLASNGQIHEKLVEIFK